MNPQDITVLIIVIGTPIALAAYCYIVNKIVFSEIDKDDDK